MGKEKIYGNLTENIGLEKFKKAERKSEKIKSFLEKTLTIVTASLSISGMVFAKNISQAIYDNVYGTGQGVATAINEGYIEKTENNYVTENTVVEDENTGNIIEDVETKVKIDEFIMDDFSLSITFDVEFSDKIKEIINPSNINQMDFSDMIIYDENNIVLLSTKMTMFDKFKEEMNLDYDFENAPNDKLIGSGVNSYILEKSENNIKVIYNIYTGGDTIYPKSRKLNVKIDKIKIDSNIEIQKGYEEISITGDWNIQADVPEKMYNRQNLVYVQKSTTNKDFNVTSAVVYNTGIKLEYNFPAKESSEEVTIPEIEFYNSLPENSELKTLDILNFISRKLYALPEYQEYEKERMKVWQLEEDYVLNENGEKFNFTVGPVENGSGHIDENNIYNRSAMYDLTTYNATDTITFHIKYNGTEADIVLEKVEE